MSIYTYRPSPKKPTSEKIVSWVTASCAIISALAALWQATGGNIPQFL